jgi:hypothetical protein
MIFAFKQIRLHTQKMGFDFDDYRDKIMEKKGAQQSVPHDHRDKYAPDPRKSTETMVVGVCAFSGSFCGLRLVPAQWRYLVPRQQYPYGA